MPSRLGMVSNGRFLRLVSRDTNCCRLPSIVWQFLWNYFFGPYLIWKIRMIRDIYHWRLQTILAVVAGLEALRLFKFSFG